MTTQSIEIRAATLGDTLAIANLLTQLGYPNTPADVGGRLAAMDEDAGDRALVACEGDAVLGFAAVHLIPMIHHDGCVARVTAFVVDASLHSTWMCPRGSAIHQTGTNALRWSV